MYERNIWFHIDGSIGGIFAITSIPIDGLNNIHQANSITINPQKIIGITKTSSLLLVSNMNTLENTFSTGLPYISSKENILNRGEIGIQGSRPAEVIKLWLGLRFLGLNGIENILKSSIKRKEFFVKNISKINLIYIQVLFILFHSYQINLSQKTLMHGLRLK